MTLAAKERDAFVEQNLGLVHSCAKRFRGRGMEYDDLYGAGCLGLLKAIDGFEPERGLRFSTYAVPVILGEIKRLFRDGGAVKVSRSLKEASLKISRAREKLSAETGREPTVRELAKATGCTEERVTEALLATRPTVSLTEAWEEGDRQTDLVFDPPEESLTERLSLMAAVNRLLPRDRRLLELRYFQNKTQTETASLLSMTQVQVSRREKKILLALRAELS